MSVVFERKGDTLVALLSGEIDHHTASEFRESIDRETEMGHWSDHGKVQERGGLRRLGSRGECPSYDRADDEARRNGKAGCI